MNYKLPLVIGIIAYLLMDPLFTINYNHHCYKWPTSIEDSLANQQLVQRECPCIVKYNWQQEWSAWTNFFSPNGNGMFMLITVVMAFLVYWTFGKWGYREAVIAGVVRWSYFAFVQDWLLGLPGFFKSSPWSQHMMYFEFGIMVGGYLAATWIIKKYRPFGVRL